jgi:hypothetical protein
MARAVNMRGQGALRASALARPGRCAGQPAGIRAGGQDKGCTA